MEPVIVILTSILSIATLFLIAKLMGHRQIAQLDVFDYITGITIGSIAAELATDLEDPIQPLLAMLFYGGFTMLLNIITNKSGRASRFINGTPVVILKNGTLHRENMKKAKLDLSELLLMCRQAGYFDLSALQMAVFEYNGTMSFLPWGESRPATPQDMKLPVEKNPIYTEVIMDGRVIEKNLHRLGLDDTWLTKQLHAQGYHGPREVFLGQCDENQKLLLFGMK